MADSHDHVPNVEKAVDVFVRERVELVLHAGDFVAPFAVAPLARLDCEVVAVFGNNDGERLGLQRRFDQLGARVEPNVATVEAGDLRIGVTHYPEVAEPMAQGDAFDLVVYGHTHQIDDRTLASRIVNPGETGGWLTGRATVMILDSESLMAEVVDLG
ncbi:MAG: metallophosphoesterase [Thermoanaerobaculia bacterium]|nr:metallophosphoesterase [Thermoanaerobaculia bacterium]